MIGIYFPVDSNMLLAVAEKCYKSTNKINAIIAGKQPAATWLTLDEARAELEKGAAEWKWASNVKSNDEAQIVLAATGLPLFLGPADVQQAGRHGHQDQGRQRG